MNDAVINTFEDDNVSIYSSVIMMTTC